MYHKNSVKKLFLGILALFVAILVWPTNAVISGISAYSVEPPIKEQTETSSENTENKGEILSQTSTTSPTDLQDAQKSNYDGFAIEIPKISLFKDIQANVNPADPAIYLPVIDKKVAHGLSTSLPDEPDGNTYLFAHSKKYYGNGTPDMGWFTRIDELRPGDRIFIHYDGQKYTYIVVESFIVEPSQTEVYTDDSPFDTHSLTLQTCFPRGTTDRRLIVLAMGE